VVVVACSKEIQLQRLMARAHLAPNDALAMIASQMPLPEKISRADHVIWNNGAPSELGAQASVLADFFAGE
jgi:dephospho-CoA kinase